jgi:CheY-like chemotaxis protein
MDADSFGRGPDMASAPSDALARPKIVIDHVTTLIDAREAARLLSYDAILLDRQLTDGEGLKLIPELRAEGIDVPIIVLAAHNDYEGRIRGLDLGADDYMGKAFCGRGTGRTSPSGSPSATAPLFGRHYGGPPVLRGGAYGAFAGWQTAYSAAPRTADAGGLDEAIGRTVTREALANAVITSTWRSSRTRWIPMSPPQEETNRP